MDKVSIIIPVFNSAEFLPKCIESCINQTYQNLEIVIVIDGSPDNSCLIAESYMANDNRIKVINKINEGLPKTRRTGFESSTGSYIFHLDSDDYIEHDTIECLLLAMKKHEADMVVSWTRYEDKNGKYITKWESRISGNTKTDYLSDIFKSNLQPNIWGRLIKRELFQPVLVPQEFNCGEDYLANVMMICYSPVIRIAIVDRILYHYVVYNESLTNTWPAEVFMPFTDLIEKILIEHNLEEKIIDDWAYFRVINSWRYYLRRGGKDYLKDNNYIRCFYRKYYSIIRERLTVLERIELNLYRYSQFAGFNFSRAYSKITKIKNKYI